MKMPIAKQKILSPKFVFYLPGDFLSRDLHSSCRKILPVQTCPVLFYYAGPLSPDMSNDQLYLVWGEGREPRERPISPYFAKIRRRERVGFKRPTTPPPFPWSVSQVFFFQPAPATEQTTRGCWQTNWSPPLLDHNITSRCFTVRKSGKHYPLISKERSAEPAVVRRKIHPDDSHSAWSVPSPCSVVSVVVFFSYSFHVHHCNGHRTERAVTSSIRNVYRFEWALSIDLFNCILTTTISSLKSTSLKTIR